MDEKELAQQVSLISSSIAAAGVDEHGSCLDQTESEIL
jgi:hypothetical protein